MPQTGSFFVFSFPFSAGLNKVVCKTVMSVLPPFRMRSNPCNAKSVFLHLRLFQHNPILVVWPKRIASLSERALQYVQNVTPSLDFQFRKGQKKDFNGGKKGDTAERAKDT